ncbi:hypothetical protein B566_EDAN007987 [Ephemera danica]|nr:hypothetical protein B566_EDAN007987 [Ephemera danica]
MFCVMQQRIIHFTRICRRCGVKKLITGCLLSVPAHLFEIFHVFRLFLGTGLGWCVRAARAGLGCPLPPLHPKRSPAGAPPGNSASAAARRPLAGKLTASQPQLLPPVPPHGCVNERQPAGRRPPRKAAPASTTAAGAVVSASNFEYDDNEWDIGIGNLIIDLDADIEKTNEKGGVGAAGTVGVGVVPPQQPQQAANNNTINNNNNFHSNSMASTGTGASGGAKGKMSAAAAVEHSATVDKGLKMKIKRTKPGTKEAKHEIVKAPVQDGATGATTVNNASSIVAQNGDSVECAKVGAGSKHPGGTGGSKRGSSGHRRDKARDKHADKQQQQQQQQPALAKTADVNGVLPATPVVSGAGGVTGPPTAAVAPTSAQQQLPATPTVAAAPGPTPPLPVSSQPQVTPPSPASQVQSVPLQPTVPSSAVVQQQQASPVTPAVPPQSVLQQPPAAAADLPPQATTLLVFPGTGPTAPGVCVSVTGGNTNKSLALQQQPPSEPPSAKPSAVKQQAAGLEDTGPTSAGSSSSCTSTSPPPSKKLKTGPLVNCVGSTATAVSCALTTNGPSCGDPKVSPLTASLLASIEMSLQTN